MKEGLTATMFQTPERIPTGQPGIYLRLARAEDAPEMYKVVNSNQQYFEEYLEWTKNYTIQKAASIEQEAQAKIEAGTMLRYRIINEATTGIIGEVSLYDKDAETETAKGGYMLTEAAQGHGYATAALGSLLEYGFANWGLKAVTFEIAEGNVQSEAVVERFGAVPSSDLVLDDPEQRYYRTWTIASEQ